MVRRQRVRFAPGVGVGAWLGVAPRLGLYCLPMTTCPTGAVAFGCGWAEPVVGSGAGQAAGSLSQAATVEAGSKHSAALS